jgi:hypothetical protein
VRLQPLGHPSSAADISEARSRLQRLTGCFARFALGLHVALKLGAQHANARLQRGTVDDGKKRW